MADGGALSKRAEELTASMTLVISNRAKQLRAEGHTVIGYGAGEPDFPTPAHIVEAARAAALDPVNHRYSPVAGLPELREAIAAKTFRDSGYRASADQVVVTNGAKQAVYLACQALLDAGDEVLVPSPYWVTYPEAVRLADAVPIAVEAGEGNAFRVTVDELEAASSARTKMLIFVSPDNPTGAVYSAEAVGEIGRWAAARGIWVVTDEIYEHLVYGGATFSSVPVAAPELEGRCVIVNGVAKTYAMTGWRVGWIVGPHEVADAAARLQSHISSNVANVSQRAALAALGGSLEAVTRMREAFERRAKTMVDMLRATKGISCIRPQGAFYAFPNVSGLLGRPLRGRVAATSLDLAALLLEEIEIAAVPGEAFGAPGYMRFSFALGDEDLVTGLERLQDLAGLI